MEKIERYIDTILLQERGDGLLKEVSLLINSGFYQSILSKEYFDKILLSLKDTFITPFLFWDFADSLLHLYEKGLIGSEALSNRYFINLLACHLQKDIEQGVDSCYLTRKYAGYLLCDSEGVLISLLRPVYSLQEKENIQKILFSYIDSNTIKSILKLPFEKIEYQYGEQVVNLYVRGCISEDVWLDILNKNKVEHILLNEKSLDLLIKSGKLEEKTEYYTCLFLKSLNDQTAKDKESISNILLKIEKFWKKRGYNYNVATWLYINAFIKSCDNEKSQEIFLSCLEKAPEMMKKYVFSYKETKDILFTLDNISWCNFLKIIKYCFELNIFMNDTWNKQNIIKYSVLPMLFKLAKTEKDYIRSIEKLQVYFPEMEFLKNREHVTEIILNNSLNCFNKNGFYKWSCGYKHSQLNIFINNVKEKRRVNICENLFNKLYKNYEENEKCTNREIFIDLIEAIVRQSGEIKNIKLRTTDTSMFYQLYSEAEHRVIQNKKTACVVGEECVERRGRRRL